MADYVTCIYCQHKYKTKDEAKDCAKSHENGDIIIIPMLKEDLSILAHYIMSGNRQILTERASNVIMRYFRKI